MNSCWSFTICLATAAVCVHSAYAQERGARDEAQLRKLHASLVSAQQNDDYDLAIKVAEQILDLNSKAQGADHWEVADQKWQVALLRKIAAMSRDERAVWIKARQGMADAAKLRERGAFRQAIPLCREYLAQCEKALGDSHVETANALNEVARSVAMAGQPSEAQPIYERALEIWKKLLGENHPDTAAGYNNVALNLDGLGRSREALPLHQAGLKIKLAVFGEDHADTIVGYSNLGSNLQNLGKPAEAESFFRKALAATRRRHQGDHPTIARECLNLSLNLDVQGKAAEALPLAQEAVDVCRRTLTEKHPHMATCLNNLGNIYLHQSRYAEAAETHTAALAIRQRLLGNDHPQTASSLNNLASALMSQEKYAEAQERLQAALAIFRQAYGEQHPETATAYMNLANSASKLGRKDEADRLHAQALAIYRATVGENHPQYAQALHNHAVSLNGAGEEATAERHLLTTLEIYRRAYGEHHEETVRSYLSLIGCLMRQRKWDQARQYAEDCARSYEGTRIRLAAKELERSFTAGQFPYRLLAALRIQAETPEAAWAAAEADLARGLLDRVAAGRRQGPTAAEQNQLATLFARLQDIAPLVLRIASQLEPSAADRDELQKLTDERRRLEMQVAELAVAAGQRELASLARVQASLPADAAIVLWIDLSGAIEEHWGCVVRSTGPPHWERLPGSGAAAAWLAADGNLTSKLSSAIGYGEETAAELEILKRKLRDQRITPLLPHLNGVKSLYVVPVHFMSGFPVETIVPEFTVSCLPSGSFLAGLKEKRRPGTGNRLLVLGDPDYRLTDWPELPGTRVEVNGIAKVFGMSAKSLVGESASGDSLGELLLGGELEKFRYLHFAAHGETNELKPFESALILSGGGLQAVDVLKHWKLNADLVTLSACDSAIGAYAGGDGFLGFEQAFLTAGSRAVCLSLWKVDDVATALLMQRFYQNLLGRRPGLDKPLGKAAALAEAKTWLQGLSSAEADQLLGTMSTGVSRGSKQGRAVIGAVPRVEEKEKPFAHPKYWAAFVLIGDPD